MIDHFKYLIYKTRNIPYNGLAGVDIALWDLKGKIENKSISNILGRKKDFLIPYSSFVILSEPDERAEMAKSIQQEGWKVIKVRLHHDEADRDIETIEKIVEKTSGEIEILVDANQAQSSYPWQPGIIWDFDRAKKMNEAMSDLGCYWLEEPRPRFNYEELSELVAMNKTKIAGGENNTVVADFHHMVEKNTYDISIYIYIYLYIHTHTIYLFICALGLGLPAHTKLWRANLGSCQRSQNTIGSTPG